MERKKIVEYEEWKAENVTYVETTIDGKKQFLFTPTELINARARWLKEQNWDNIIVRLKE